MSNANVFLENFQLATRILYSIIRNFNYFRPKSCYFFYPVSCGFLFTEHGVVYYHFAHWVNVLFVFVIFLFFVFFVLTSLQ